MLDVNIDMEKLIVGTKEPYVCLGDALMVLSVFNSCMQQVELRTDKVAYWEEWKHRLNLTDKIEIVYSSEITEEQNNLYHLLLQYKFFAKYIQPSEINILGSTHTVKTSKVYKPCIGIAMSSGQVKNEEFYSSLKTDPNSYPNEKFHSLDVYSKLFELITLAGYDPIVFDSYGISLETKMFLVNEMCDCVIGYEGGIGHLAHVLQVPSIVLPYSGEQSKEMFIHSKHVDTQTYFVDDINEFKEWDVNRLRDVIDALKKHMGNNMFFDLSCEVLPLSREQIAGVKEYLRTTNVGGLDNKWFLTYNFESK